MLISDRCGLRAYFEEEEATSTSSVINQLGTGGLVIFPRWRCLRGDVLLVNTGCGWSKQTLLKDQYGHV
jgi:hypothetical protein